MSDVSEVETRRIQAHELHPGVEVVGLGVVERVYKDLMIVRARFEVDDDGERRGDLLLTALDDVDVVLESYEY